MICDLPHDHPAHFVYGGTDWCQGRTTATAPSDSLDLDRPASVRKIFDAITANNHVAALAVLGYSEPQVRAIVEVMGSVERRSSWDTASAIYDALGCP